MLESLAKRNAILIFVLLFHLGLLHQSSDAWQFESRDVEKMIAQLDDESVDQREDAAQSLSQTVMPSRISPAIQQRLKVETDFHVKLSLYFVLASQGERSALIPLIESLSRKGHMGCNYLRYSTDQDFGWNADRYQQWFDKTSDGQFLEFINERWRRKPMMDEYREFESLFFKQSFGSMFVKTGELFDPDQQLSDAEKKKLAELPTAKSWQLFSKALNELDRNGNRKAAVEHFDQIIKTYPDTIYADQARELLPHLKKMIDEDENYKVPDHFSELSLDKQTALHIHNLRNARAYQFTQPGSCQLWFHGSADPRDKTYNPAAALVAIGDPAAKRLAELLEDRRPIRGIGYLRTFVPIRQVLRYGDAAEQIIREIEQKQ